MFYPLSSNSWGKEEALVFQRILEKGRFTMGESVKKFEYLFYPQKMTQISLHSLP
jgi:hypothetical protein